MPLNERASRAKRLADDILRYLDGSKTPPDIEAKMTGVHNYLVQEVTECGGPAWNASEEQWEY